MSDIFNIYCDESCHLEHDHQRVMVLGAVCCSQKKTREIAVRIREIKQRHSLPSSFEIKWSKVSPAKLPFYMDLLDYFFDDDDLHFRALIVPDKTQLRHDAFEQDHDTWYYNMYFDMLKVLLSPGDEYRIYLDIKDSASARRVAKLQEVLRNNRYDFKRHIIAWVQVLRSHHVEQLQLADFLIGIVSYANRNLDTSPAKSRLVGRMRERSGYHLTRSTLLREEKVNLFRWTPRGVAA